MRPYKKTFNKSIENHQVFRAKAAYSIDWYIKSDSVLNRCPPYYLWFRIGEVNTCYNNLKMVGYPEKYQLGYIEGYETP